MKKCVLLLMIFMGLTAKAQTTFTGQVIDDSGMPIPLANISLKGENIGTVTDFDGVFTLTVSKELPVTIVASSVGYESTTVLVTSETEEIKIVLKEGSELDIVVVSASRAPERIFESPVSVESFGTKDIKQTTSSNFYAGLGDLKGVDVNTNSLTFNSINTRGFASFTNTRFVQLIDGMDNTSPSLNFVLGNLIGISELDVDNIELLPGASSALYGANAFNGILFMNSKNPFDHEGISAYAKSGLTSQDAAGNNIYYDAGIRLAHAFSDKIAAKINFSYIDGTDWFAVDNSNIFNPGQSRTQDPVYDGLNIYGDEVRTNIKTVAEQFIGQPINPNDPNSEPITQEFIDQNVPQQFVSRTGYEERNLTDYKAQSLKLDGAIHYRPNADDFEIIYVGRIGRGKTIFQDTNRFSLNDFLLQQHKLEIKNDNFFIRGYVTAEDAGDTYDMRFAGINVNREWKEDRIWFGEYARAFMLARASQADEGTAHNSARDFAQIGRLVPGSEEFQTAFDRVVESPDLTDGARLVSRTNLIHSDANYNFSHLTKDFADIQVGGSFRRYELISDGKVFTDPFGGITYSEFGIYSQIQKKLIDDRLKLTGSIRYDKSELFEGNFSPRFSIGYTLGQRRNRNLRFSIQTGFRNPTTQDLYLGIDTGQAVVLGSAPDNPERFSRTLPNSQGTTTTVTGTSAYENSFTANSVIDFARTGNPGLLEIANPDIVKPEKVTSFELGYRAKFGKVIVDFSGYYNQYQDFISNEDVVAPFVGDNSNFVIPAGFNPDDPATFALLNEDTRQIIGSFSNGDFAGYQTVTNSDVDINSVGVVLGLTTKIFGNFDLGGSYTYADQDFDEAENPSFRTSFNTPKHKFKASFGNESLFENFGFNTNVRWSDEYLWESSFATGTVPSYTVIDAQVNYRIPSFKSVIKLGATNIGNEYLIAPGTGLIGSQYYIGVTINNF